MIKFHKIYQLILVFKLIKLIYCDFKVDKCNLADIIDLNKNKYQDKRSNQIELYLSIDDINNLDYLSNTFNFQLTILEIYKEIKNISTNYLDDDNEISLIKEINYRLIEKLYPNLILNELDYENRDEFKQFYYFKKRNLLIKKLKLNLQTRCMIDMQNYPFINSPCKLSFHSLALNKFNYTICNLDNLLNKKFSFNKFNINIISLSILNQCNYLNNLEQNLILIKCFQLLIQFESSKRYFYINFLITFNLLLISYLSLYIPIYNHTSRCLMLILPILGIYLFDQTLFKNDKLIQLESNSLHIWRLACLLYIGFNFICYIIAFYSLEKVKNLVEKSDIEYLGYMLKSAKLVQDENVINEMNKKLNNEQMNLESKKLPSISLTIKSNTNKLIDLNKIGFNIKKNLNRTYSKLNLSSRIHKFKTNSSIGNLKTLKINKSLSHFESLKSNKSLIFNQINSLKSTKSLVKIMKSNKSLTSIKPIKSNKSLTSIKPLKSNKSLTKLIPETNESITKISNDEINLKSDNKIEKELTFELKDTINLIKDLDNLKRDLTNDDKKLNREKAKSLRILNDILNFKNKNKSNFKRKKIVSRFISSSKLKTIEFISLIPSDRYARVMVPFSFFIFIYFYALHFIM